MVVDLKKISSSAAAALGLPVQGGKGRMLPLGCGSMTDKGHKTTIDFALCPFSAA